MQFHVLKASASTSDLKHFLHKPLYIEPVILKILLLQRKDDSLWLPTGPSHHKNLSRKFLQEKPVNQAELELEICPQHQGGKTTLPRCCRTNSRETCPKEKSAVCKWFHMEWNQIPPAGINSVLGPGNVSLLHRGEIQFPCTLSICLPLFFYCFLIAPFYK